MASVTVVCPHCGSTGTYQHGIGASSIGATGVQCFECRKSFRIAMDRGNLKSVTKS